MAPNYQNEVEEMASTDQENFFDTPVIEVPPSAPQAHRAVITSVTLKTIATREDWPVVEIGVTSRDVPTLDDKFGIFIPKSYDVSEGSRFDVSSLP